MRLLRPSALAALTAGLLSHPASGADEALSFRGSATWLNAYVHGTVLDDPRNPDNQVLELPADSFVSQLRPTVKLVSSSLQLVARPRLTFEVDKVKVGTGTRPYRGHSASVWSEAFAQWTMSERATLALGRQNFQWGAAEALNPSNRLFHESVESRSILYEVSGRNLARLNLSLGKSWSTILIGEYEENKDLAPYVAGQKFQSAGLMKNEVNWNSGSDYLGFVFGGREKGRGWLGEYFNVTVPYVDGFSLYADARHEKGSEAWYPVTQGVVTAYAQSKNGKEHVYTLAVYGLKYDFEGGNTLRAEYVLNDAGYDEGETKLQTKAFDTRANPVELTVFPANAARALTPGLELPGRRYAFVSAYIPDFFKLTDFTTYARALYSLTDKSTSAYGSAEYTLKDAGTLLAAVAGTPKKGELRGFTSPTYTVGYKHLW